MDQKYRNQVFDLLTLMSFSYGFNYFNVPFANCEIWSIHT